MDRADESLLHKYLLKFVHSSTTNLTMLEHVISICDPAKSAFIFQAG